MQNLFRNDSRPPWLRREAVLTQLSREVLQRAIMTVGWQRTRERLQMMEHRDAFIGKFRFEEPLLWEPYSFSFVTTPADRIAQHLNNYVE